MPTIMDGFDPETLLTSVMRGGAGASNRLPVTFSFGIGSPRKSYPCRHHCIFCLNVGSFGVSCGNPFHTIGGPAIQSLSVPNQEPPRYGVAG
jgi:hypothetical protein